MLKIVLLPEPFGTDQAENLALVDRERDVVDGLEAAKAFYQALNYQHGGPFRRSGATYL